MQPFLLHIGIALPYILHRLKRALDRMRLILLDRDDHPVAHRQHHLVQHRDKLIVDRPQRLEKRIMVHRMPEDLLLYIPRERQPAVAQDTPELTVQSHTDDHIVVLLRKPRP